MTTDLEIIDLYARRHREFGRECPKRAIVVLVAQELHIQEDRVWRAIRAQTAYRSEGASRG